MKKKALSYNIQFGIAHTVDASEFYLSNTSISLRGKQIVYWAATDFIRSSELMIHVAREPVSPGNLCWSACWQRRGPQPSLSD